MPANGLQTSSLSWHVLCPSYAFIHAGLTSLGMKQMLTRSQAHSQSSREQHLRYSWSFCLPYMRSIKNSFSERKRRPSGICQSCTPHLTLSTQLVSLYTLHPGTQAKFMYSNNDVPQHPLGELRHVVTGLAWFGFTQDTIQYMVGVEGGPDLVVVGVALCAEEGWRDRQRRLQGLCILYPHAAAVEVCEEPPTASQHPSEAYPRPCE